MVIRELIRDISNKLKASGIENHLFEAHLIARHFLALSPLDIVLKGNDIVTKDIADKAFSVVLRRTEGEPLQYILGTQEFMGLDFLVEPSVLIPRSDTERLVEHVLEHFGKKPITALDLCTGSGCIAVSLAHFNKNAYVTGIDISPDAVAVAEKNAKKHNVSDRVSFKIQDIFSMDFFGKFDLLISNPPYIKSDVIPTLSKNVVGFEPGIALDGGCDGLDFYRHIINISPKYLSPDSMLAFEIGYDQKDAVSALMEKDFYSIQAIKDYGGCDRVISGIKKQEEIT